MTKNNNPDNGEIFSDVKNFSQFILKYKNHFEKRKYFQLDENFRTVKKEPSFIMELAYIHLDEKNKNENIAKIINNEFLETYREKEKKIERLSKIELSKLIDAFRRSIFNKESIYSVKLGNELLYRDKNKFFEILYNFSLISMDTDKLVKTFFMEKIIEKIYEENGSKFSDIRNKVDEVVKNTLNYFTKSDSCLIDFENEENIKYFVENRADLLYKKIYVENYNKIVEKYNIQNVRKIEFNKEFDYNELTEGKKILYNYICLI